MGTGSCLGFFLLLALSASFGESKYLKYKDPKQALGVRIKDLMKRMTLAEKIGQMTQIERGVASADVVKQYYIGIPSASLSRLPLFYILSSCE